MSLAFCRVGPQEALTMIKSAHEDPLTHWNHRPPSSCLH